MKKKRKAKVQLVEVARSFSFKLNVGNYESRDFFCSQKAECNAKDVEKVSEALHEFCKREVLKGVNEFVKAVEDEKNAVAAALEKETNKTSFINEKTEKSKESAQLGLADF